MIDYDKFCSVKYHVCLSSPSLLKNKNIQIVASKKNGTFETTAFSALGDLLADIDVIASGQDAKLVITNNETSQIKASVLRTLIF